MGKNRKRTKTNHTHSRTIWKGVERAVKRQEIDKANQQAADPAAEISDNKAAIVTKSDSNGERTESECNRERSND